MTFRLQSFLPKSRVARGAIVFIVIALFVPGTLAIRRYHNNAELERLLRASCGGGDVVTTHWKGQVDHALVVLSDTQFGPLPKVGEWLHDAWHLAGEPIGVGATLPGCDLKKILPRLENLSDLQFIQFDNCGTIGDELNSVAASKNLKRLWLRGMTITPSAMEAIGTFKDLEDLNLQNSAGVDDGTVQAIGKLSHLKQLSLAGTDVTDQGVTSLESLKGLSELSLWRTDVTDASVPVLVSMAPRTLIVTGTDITTEGVAKLRLSLPSTTVKAE